MWHRQGSYEKLKNEQRQPCNDVNPTAPQLKRERAIFFRLGPLRFGFHGIFGMLGIIAVSYAFFKSFMGESIPLWLAFSILVTTLSSSFGSYGLLSQVPKTSKIASWIFPPHKEAFKRTIAIVGYLNIRLVHEWQWILGNESLVFPLLLSFYTSYHFFPRQTDYFNGNTWVFVIPMFIGFSTDTFMQFPKLDKGMLISDRNWNDVNDWNKNRVNETYLLLTLLCALQIAFMFTLAFRGLISIRFCYWIAAVQVGLLCIRLYNG